MAIYMVRRGFGFEKERGYGFWMDVREVLAHLLAGHSLTRASACDVFTDLLSGRMEPSQIGALVALMQQRGPTADELAGAGEVMRAHVTPVERPAGMERVPVLDTCGTGGTPKTFNISTAAAIVAASASGRRFLVSKHGNKSRSGRGSAEVLERLGVNVSAPPEVQTRCLRDVGLCFCFAVHHHPAMKHAGPVRLALGFPTIFNLLGPLTNPARADRQLMGVFAPRYVEPMARALAGLGSTRALVLHSDDGMDEISTCAATRAAEVVGGGVREGVTIDPSAWGVPRGSLAALTVASLDEAADAVRGVLDGEPGPRRDAVLVNAAAALVVGGAYTDYSTAIGAAREAVDSGAAAATLSMLVRASQ